MSASDSIALEPAQTAEPGAALLRQLVDAPLASKAPPSMITGAVIGELLAIAPEGNTPLVRYPGQPGSAALPARSTQDLHGTHIGSSVVLMFNEGDPRQPIVMGVLRDTLPAWPAAEVQQVQVEADGQRLVVNAKEQLVLRCGKASITLTKAGKVLIDGQYISSRSSGVNRIKGGSVQLN
jgi:hypothetical protein